MVLQIFKSVSVFGLNLGVHVVSGYIHINVFYFLKQLIVEADFKTLLPGKGQIRLGYVVTDKTPIKK